MSGKFKVGDTVKYIGDDPRFYSKVAIVVESRYMSDTHTTVKYNNININGSDTWLHPHNHIEILPQYNTKLAELL